jgi:hypothetical protein
MAVAPCAISTSRPKLSGTIAAESGYRMRYDSGFLLALRLVCYDAQAFAIGPTCTQGDS